RLFVTAPTQSSSGRPNAGGRTASLPAALRPNRKENHNFCETNGVIRAISGPDSRKSHPHALQNSIVPATAQVAGFHRTGAVGRVDQDRLLVRGQLFQGNEAPEVPLASGNPHGADASHEVMAGVGLPGIAYHERCPPLSARGGPSPDFHPV